MQMMNEFLASDRAGETLLKSIKTILPYLAGSSLVYFLIPTSAMLIWAIPIICFSIAIAYGMCYSFNVLYAFLVMILVVPLTMLRFPLSFSLFYAVGCGIVSLIGNGIGMLLYKRNVRVKHPARLSRCLIIVVIGSYIVTMVGSAIMMGRMTQITYNATAFGATIREDIIDFDANITKRSCFDFVGNLTVNQETTMSKPEEMVIKVVCSVSLFPLWHESYENPYIMDGDQYNIVRHCDNGSSVVYGSNAYPLTYRLVMMAIERAIE